MVAIVFSPNIKILHLHNRYRTSSNRFLSGTPAVISLNVKYELSCFILKCPLDIKDLSI